MIAQRLEARGLRVHNIPGDTIRAGKGAIADAIAQLKLEGYGISYVVNNFGINHLSWIGETPEMDEDILKVNVMGPYWVVNELVRFQLGPARVLNIASQTHKVPQRTTSLYCASKAALVQMTRVMARELAPRGWVVNALAPGKIGDTRMSQLTDAQVMDLRGWDPEVADNYAKSLIPMGRYTNRDEVASAALQILLDMPEYINGEVINMTGGV